MMYVVLLAAGEVARDALVAEIGGSSIDCEEVRLLPASSSAFACRCGCCGLWLSLLLCMLPQVLLHVALPPLRVARGCLAGHTISALI